MFANLNAYTTPRLRLTSKYTNWLFNVWWKVVSYAQLRCNYSLNSIVNAPINFPWPNGYTKATTQDKRNFITQHEFVLFLCFYVYKEFHVCICKSDYSWMYHHFILIESVPKSFHNGRLFPSLMSLPVERALSLNHGFIGMRTTNPRYNNSYRHTENY